MPRTAPSLLRFSTPIHILAVAALFLAVGALAPPALAQEEEPEEEAEEGPGQRYATVTTFELPLEVRDQVVPYIQEHVVPLQRLNPSVVTFRVLLHNWGSNASELVFYAEYEEFADIDADCGQPCEDYQEEHPMPEEGDEGYEEFQEAERLYQEYYGEHRDEIYAVPMEAAKTEGENLGTVGPPEEEEGEGN